MKVTKLVEAWRSRSLPVTFAGAQGIRAASYSQFGEDAVVTALLGPNRRPGIYVDVGCYHPIKWSNTYALYRQGWSGICIDPNDSVAPMWARMRPRDRFINVAISTSSGRAEYIKSVHGPAENRIVAHESGASIPKAGMVETRRLDELLAQELANDTVIDLMSVDCEGHDLEVVTSNDFSRYRPKLLIVEDTGPIGEGKLHHYLVTRGYCLVGATRMSRLYENESAAQRTVPPQGETEITRED